MQYLAIFPCGSCHLKNKKIQYKFIKYVVCLKAIQRGTFEHLDLFYDGFQVILM